VFAKGCELCLDIGDVGRREQHAKKKDVVEGEMRRGRESPREWRRVPLYLDQVDPPVMPMTIAIVKGPTFSRFCRTRMPTPAVTSRTPT
jgi:hypothetical protein